MLSLKAYRNLSKILKVKRCAVTYESHKGVVDAHIDELLPGVLQKLAWGNKELILDHGCAVGSTAVKYLAPIAKRTNSMIHAIDNCENMIKFAKENYAHPKINYVCGSLTSDSSPFKDLKFNKIFSLYTLQYVDDYRAELQAMFDCLTEGGEVCLLAKLHAHFTDLFKQLHQDENYGDHAKQHLIIPKWVNESHEDNATNLTNALLKTGFEIKESKSEERPYCLKNPGVAAELMLAMNGFWTQLPQELQDDVRRKYYKFFCETETRDHKPHANSAICQYKGYYDALYVLLKKP